MILAERDEQRAFIAVMEREIRGAIPWLWLRRPHDERPLVVFVGLPYLSDVADVLRGGEAP